MMSETIIKNKLHFLEVELRPLMKRTDLANNKTVIFNFTSQRISFWSDTVDKSLYLMF